MKEKNIDLKQLKAHTLLKIKQLRGQECILRQHTYTAIKPEFIQSFKKKEKERGKKRKKGEKKKKRKEEKRTILKRNNIFYQKSALFLPANLKKMI